MFPLKMNTNDLCRIATVLANLIFETKLEPTIYQIILKPTYIKSVNMLMKLTIYSSPEIRCKENNFNFTGSNA